MPSLRADLLPHSANPTLPALRLAAEIERAGERFELRYELQGELAGVLFPPPAAPWRTDGLWRHTCFELFCAVPGGSAYYEFNFSPAGAWAAYRFGGYRERLADPELRAAPLVTLGESGEAATVDVRLDVTGLPRLAPHAPLEVALAAVVETRGHAIGHFALAHPAEQADFHDRRGFLLNLPGSGRRTR